MPADALARSLQTTRNQSCYRYSVVMACNCGNKRLPKITGQRSAPNLSGTANNDHVWFYSVAPDELGLEPVRFYTLREARQHAQRQKGPGWMVEGRNEPDREQVV